MTSQNKVATLGLLRALRDAIDTLSDNLPEPYLVNLEFAARLGNVSMAATIDLSEEVKEE